MLPAVLLSQNIGDNYYGGTICNIEEVEDSITYLIADLSYSGLLISNTKEYTYSAAIDLCKNKYDNYSDWYLPDFNELELIFQAINPKRIMHFWSYPISFWDKNKSRVVISTDPVTSYIDSKIQYNYVIPVREEVIKLNSIAVQILDYVESAVAKWENKGEFEKSSNYILRVNESSRNDMIKVFEKESIDVLKKRHIENLNFTELSISSYDADNEVFLLHSPQLGDIPLNVPIEFAHSFKESFHDATFYAPDFIIKDDNFVLSHLEVCQYDTSMSSHYRCFSYDIEDVTTYEITDVNYNFPAIQIEGVENYKGGIGLNKTKKILSVGSKVDVKIPINPKVNNRYALIIGNEDYTSYQSGLSSEQNVDFAENDAKIFKEYALSTLGVKEDNLYFLANATAGQMKQRISLVTEIIKQVGSDAELIFYYAGHGYPDELTKVPYLIPVDISANDISSAINLSDLYKTLSESQAKRITVFLDACFTGGARAQGLVASRGIKISPKQDDLNGNLVLFSASSDTQSALPYQEQGHGMFTYFLLEKLQISKGKCTYSELFDYLEEKVSLNSLKVNEKKQNPKVSSSPSINDKWLDWKF
jgi:hypothetical protein